MAASLNEKNQNPPNYVLDTLNSLDIYETLIVLISVAV